MLRYKLVFCALLVAGASASLPTVTGPSQASMQAAVDHINAGIKEVTNKFGARLQELNNATKVYAKGPERRPIWDSPEYATPAITLPKINGPAAPVLPSIPMPEFPHGKGPSGQQFSSGKGAAPIIVMPKTLHPEVVIPAQRFPSIHFGKASYKPGAIITPKDWQPPRLGLATVAVPVVGTTTTRLPALVIPTHSVAMADVSIPKLTLSKTTIPTPELGSQEIQVPVPELAKVQQNFSLPTAKLATTSFELPVVSTGKYKLPEMKVPVVVHTPPRTIYLPKLTTQKLDIVTPHAGPMPTVSGSAMQAATKQIIQGMGKLNMNMTDAAKGLGKLTSMRHQGVYLRNVTWPRIENQAVNVTGLDGKMYKLPSHEIIVPTLGHQEVTIPIVALGKGKTIEGPQVPSVKFGSKNMTIPSIKGFKDTEIPFVGMKSVNVTMPTLVRGKDVVIPGAKVPALTLVDKNITVPVVKSHSGPITIVPPKLPWIETSIVIPAHNPPALKWHGLPSMRWQKLTPLGRPTVEADFPGGTITHGGKGSLTVDIPAGGGMVVAGKGSPLLNVTVPAYSYNSRGKPQKGAQEIVIPDHPLHGMMPNIPIPSMPELPNMLPSELPSMTAPDLPDLQHPGKGSK